jgi:hypothetical protein
MEKWEHLKSKTKAIEKNHLCHSSLIAKTDLTPHPFI